MDFIQQHAKLQEEAESLLIAVMGDGMRALTLAEKSLLVAAGMMPSDVSGYQQSEQVRKLCRHFQRRQRLISQAGSERDFSAAVAESDEAVLWERLESEKLKAERRRLEEAEKDLKVEATRRKQSATAMQNARDALSRDEFLPAQLKAEMATKRKAVNETLGRDLSEAQQISTEIQGFISFADTPITDKDNQRFLQAMNLLDWKEEGSGDYKTRSPKRREPDYSQRLEGARQSLNEQTQKVSQLAAEKRQQLEAVAAMRKQSWWV
ncbi:MAG: hypothetical protein GY818_00275 [Planctomycetaceae bacterium]|nr:hypothetical protein [Planctomycetaceae bacterium]